MIADQALKLAGVPFRYGGWYPEKPPQCPFATVLDEIESWGTGAKNLAERHGVTLELYTATADSGHIASVSAALDRLGTEFKRFEPVYIRSEKFYQTLFVFEQIVKKGI